MSSTISGLVRKTELEAMRKCLRQEIQVDRMSRKEGLSDHSISGLYIQSNAIHLRDRKSQRRQNKKKSPKKQKRRNQPSSSINLKHQSSAAPSTGRMVGLAHLLPPLAADLQVIVSSIKGFGRRYVYPKKAFFFRISITFLPTAASRRTLSLGLFFSFLGFEEPSASSFSSSSSL